MAALRTD